MSSDRDELLAHIATLYYHHDQSQQEIAEQVDISRSNVSRMLKEARDRGIVEIFIRYPLRRDPMLEKQLVGRFGLREAGVSQAISGKPEATLSRMAELAARLLDGYLEGAAVLGISWGTTIQAIVQAFAPRTRHDVEVVQMMGGVGSTDPAIDGPALAQRFARALTNRYRYLHAPLIVDTPAVAQALLSQRNVAETLSVAAQADVALVGIGALEPGVSSLLRAGYLSLDEFRAIQAEGVVGDICARHFDAHGKKAAAQIDQRLVSVTLDQVANIPLVMGVAGTKAKAQAILAALRGGYLDVLVTDTDAAEAILQMADE